MSHEVPCDRVQQSPKHLMRMPTHFVRMDAISIRFWICLVALLVTVLATSCGAARAGRFEAFAVAGAGYTQARSEFLRQSLETTIERDTLELRRQQSALDASERVRVLGEQDKILRERMEIIHDLERHGEVLRQYFAALSRLATSKEDANAGAAATRLSSELGGLTSALASKSIGGNPISSLLGQGAGMAVGTFRNRALSNHLKQSAPTIDRELRLEEELLRVLAEEMIADRLALQAEERRAKVVSPFRNATPLPPSWDQERKRFLMAEVDIAKARAAQDAAKQLRLTFEALSGGGEGIGVVELQSAVQRLSDFVSDFVKSKAPNP